MIAQVGFIYHSCELIVLALSLVLASAIILTMLCVYFLRRQTMQGSGGLKSGISDANSS